VRKLNDIETAEVQMEVYECDCGFHIGLDFTYVDQVGLASVPCPSCGRTIVVDQELHKGDRQIILSTSRRQGDKSGVIVQGFGHALRVTHCLLAEKSAWCEVMPLPDDEYEVIYKSEHEVAVLAQSGLVTDCPEKGPQQDE
jgi:hypothetical protein